MSVTFLVTGGAGFIGTNFVYYLLRTYGDDARIVVVDALTYAGNRANLDEALTHENVSFVHADINDLEAMNRVFAENNPDYVVNFAAETHVDRSIDSPRVFIGTNVMGTQTLLQVALNAWRKGDGTYPDGKKFVQVSTDEVYGSLSRDFDTPRPIVLDDNDRQVFTALRDDTPAAFGKEFFTEETPLAPRSPYSAAKASADMLVMAYSHTYGLPVNITRCSNNYGAYQFPEKLIPLVINNILEGRKLPVYGKGINVRDWLYVDDHCHAIDLVCRRGKLGEIYNIGGYNEKQNIDIVRDIIGLVAEYTGTEPRYDLIEYVTDRAGHDMRYAIKPSKIAAELGWAPRTPFADGIRETVGWYLDNRDWMSSVTSGAYRDYYRRMYK